MGGTLSSRIEQVFPNPVQILLQHKSKEKDPDPASDNTLNSISIHVAQKKKL